MRFIPLAPHTQTPTHPLIARLRFLEQHRSLFSPVFSLLASWCVRVVLTFVIAVWHALGHNSLALSRLVAFLFTIYFLLIACLQFYFSGRLVTSPIIFWIVFILYTAPWKMKQVFKTRCYLYSEIYIYHWHSVRCGSRLITLDTSTPRCPDLEKQFPVLIASKSPSIWSDLSLIKKANKVKSLENFYLCSTTPPRLVFSAGRFLWLWSRVTSIGTDAPYLSR